MYVRHEWPLPFLSGCDLDFSLLSMDWVRSTSRSCAWSVPWAEGAGCRHCLGDTRSSCQAVAAALISRVSIMCYFSQYWAPSAFTPTRDFRTWRWLLTGAGAGQFRGGQYSFSGENRSNVKSQVLERKYSKDYNPTSDPCALVSTPFLQILAQKEQKGWWGTG